MARRLADPQLDAFSADVRLVTRGPLWSAERWRAIVRLNQRPLYDMPR